jgi:predicted metal-dependent hydrolase
MSGQLVPGSRFPDRDRNAEGRAENARPRDRFGRPLPRGSVDERAKNSVEAVDSVATALEIAVALFDAQRFFEAHEFFEWIWKCDEVPSGDREFWKGVTQVAVGFTHTQRGNAKGAVSLLERARRYLAPYPSPYRGIDRDALSAAAQRIVTAIDEVGPSPDLDFPTFPLAGRGTSR